MELKQLLDNNSLWFIEVNIFFLLKHILFIWNSNTFLIGQWPPPLHFNLKLDLAKDHCMKGIPWAVNMIFQICIFHRHWNPWLWEDQVNNGVAALDIIRPGMDNGDCRVPITKPPRISFSIYVSSVRVQANQLLYSLIVLYYKPCCICEPVLAIFSSQCYAPTGSLGLRQLAKVVLWAAFELRFTERCICTEMYLHKSVFAAKCICTVAGWSVVHWGQ